MASAVSPSSKFFERHEIRIVLGLLAVFLAFNILTAPFSPDAWLDEVSYSEPAATLAMTGHLSSHAWGDQTTPVWTGNAPLHQLLLAGVIKVFGFNYRTVRGINMVYFTLAVLLLYLMVRKHELIRSPANRLLFTIVLLFGTGLVAVYRNGRYDALGLVLIVFWAWCSLLSRKMPAFLIGTFVAAVLMPTASLNIAPFLMLCGLAAFILWRWKTLFALGTTGIGCLTGMAIMQLAYAHYGVPHVYHEIMKASGGRDIWGDFILSVFKNPSYVAAVAGGCLIVFPLLRRQFQENLAVNRIALLLLLMAVALPIIMMAIAKYELYYTWMAIIPGTVAAFMALEFRSVPKSVRMLTLCLILVATLPGFPRRCARIAGSWAQQRPGKIAAAVHKDVTSADVAFVSEPSALVYYALLPAVRDSFWLNPPSQENIKSSINVVFWPEPGQQSEIHNLFGGEWRQTDDVAFAQKSSRLISDGPVHFVVYRRV